MKRKLVLDKELVVKNSGTNQNGGRLAGTDDSCAETMCGFTCDPTCGEGCPGDETMNCTTDCAIGDTKHLCQANTDDC